VKCAPSFHWARKSSFTAIRLWVRLGRPGDAYQQVGGLHGLVKAPAANGFVLVNDSGPDRYIARARW